MTSGSLPTHSERATWLSLSWVIFKVKALWQNSFTFDLELEVITLPQSLVFAYPVHSLPVGRVTSWVPAGQMTTFGPWWFVEGLKSFAT